jgi:hypothetical protein
MKRRLVYTEDIDNKIYRGARTIEYTILSRTAAHVQRITERKFDSRATVITSKRLIFCLHVRMLGVLFPLKSNCGPNYGSYDLLQRQPRTNFREIVLHHSQESFGAQCLARGVGHKVSGVSVPVFVLGYHWVSGARLALRLQVWSVTPHLVIVEKLRQLHQM